MISAEEIREAATREHARTVEERRHLHAHPELSFEEKETSAFVAASLESAGVAHKTGVGGHGVVGLIEGGGNRTVALRADMDALPIHEANDVPYRSTNEGVMHACGHDGHTAGLLAAGRILNALRDRLPGNVKLIFQPAEERAPGGAKAMIAAGVLASPAVSTALGQHVNPELPAGTVGFKPGLFMGSVDDVYIRIHGKGGHAAKPHQGTDPIAIAGALIVALQQIVSRNADPVSPGVLSFGYIMGDGSNNVIPDVVDLRGTFRTFDPEWRDEAVQRIENMTTGLVTSMGAEPEIRFVRGYPALENHPEITARARQKAVEYLGEENVVELPPALWAEDFAYFSKEMPACFYNLGVRNEGQGIVHPVHSPTFNLDERALEVGAGLLAWIALGELSA